MQLFQINQSEDSSKITIMSDTTCGQLHQHPITSASNYNRITLAVPSSGPPPAPPRPSRTGRRALGPRCCSRRLGWAGWAGPRTPAGTTWTRSCGASTGTTPWRATSASSQTSGGWTLVLQKGPSEGSYSRRRPLQGPSPG